MGLDELGPALPPLERILIPCKMGGGLEAPTRTGRAARAAIKERSHGGKGPPTLACTRIQVLDAFLDKPWGWSPIRAPKFDDNGRRCGWKMSLGPNDLGENFADEKDRKLVEIVRSELKAGRRCCDLSAIHRYSRCPAENLKLLTDAGVRANDFAGHGEARGA